MKVRIPDQIYQNGPLMPEIHNASFQSTMLPYIILPRRNRGFWPGKYPVWILVLLLCIGQVVLWGVATSLTYRSPEIDSAEQLVWSFSLENGYWKHPPLPSWIMHFMLGVFGHSVVLPFVLTQVAIVIALALTWRLGCEVMSPQRSLIAMLLTSLVAYHNIGGDSYNHNTVLLPFQAAMTLSFFLAARRGSMLLWATAGLFAALSMLVKYVALMPITGLLFYLLLDRKLHHRRTWAGLALGTMVFVLIMLPHLLWLQATDFMMFNYARMIIHPTTGLMSSLRALKDFILTQLVRLAPLLLALAFILMRNRTAARVRAATLALPRRDQMFLWIAALAPLTITLIFGIVSQTKLESRWGANAFLWSGLLAMMLIRRVDTKQMLGAALGFSIVAHLVLVLGLTLGKSVIAEHFERRTRANFPGAFLTSETLRIWNAHTDVPLRIVVADIWLGGNIVANTQHRLAVLIDGDYRKTPWVKPQDIINCGAMVLDDQTSDDPVAQGQNPAFDALMANASSIGTWSLPWATAKLRGDPHINKTIRWGIIPPKDPARCSMK